MVKNPEKVLDIEMLKKYSIALYGAGASGQSVKRILDTNIVLWVDQNYVEFQKRSIDVKSVEELRNDFYKYDVILIAITNETICLDVVKKLREEGINKPIIYYKYNNGSLIIQESYV